MARSRIFRGITFSFWKSSLDWMLVLPGLTLPVQTLESQASQKHTARLCPRTAIPSLLLRSALSLRRREEELACIALEPEARRTGGAIPAFVLSERNPYFGSSAHRAEPVFSGLNGFQDFGGALESSGAVFEVHL